MPNLLPDQRHQVPAELHPSQRVSTFRALYERAVLTWKLIWDRRVSFLPKLIPLLAVGYTISPLDLAPALAMGPLAPLGALDDIGILLLALGLFIEACPPDIVREYQRELGATRSNLPAGGNVVDGEIHGPDE